MSLKFIYTNNRTTYNVHISQFCHYCITSNKSIKFIRKAEVFQVKEAQFSNVWLMVALECFIIHSIHSHVVLLPKWKSLSNKFSNGTHRHADIQRFLVISVRFCDVAKPENSWELFFSVGFHCDTDLASFHLIWIGFGPAFFFCPSCTQFSILTIIFLRESPVIKVKISQVFLVWKFRISIWTITDNDNN